MKHKDDPITATMTYEQLKWIVPESTRRPFEVTRNSCIGICM